MKHPVDQMAEIIAQHVDPAQARTLIPTALLIRHLADHGGQHAWEAAQKNAQGVSLGVLLDQAVDQCADCCPEAAAAKIEHSHSAPVPPQPSERILALTDELANTGANMDDAHQRIQGLLNSRSAKERGQFFTPPSVAKLLAQLLTKTLGVAPESIYDPAVGGGALLTHAYTVANANARVYGQEINHTNAKLARMNLITRGATHDVKTGDTIADDLMPDLQAHAVVANPPFNAKQPRMPAMPIDPRWKFGSPPQNNANYAWLQHCLHHTAKDGVALVIMPPGSLNSTNQQETYIRRQLVEQEHVHAIISLPPQLFVGTQVAAAVWVLAKRPLTRDGVLMISASNMGSMISRTQRALSPEDIDRIADAFASQTAEPASCARATDLRQRAYCLSPAAYAAKPVGNHEAGEFETKMRTLTQELRELRKESRALDEKIERNLATLGFA